MLKLFALTPYSVRSHIITLVIVDSGGIPEDTSTRDVQNGVETSDIQTISAREENKLKNAHNIPPDESNSRKLS
jgi:hypothetical protein